MRSPCDPPTFDEQDWSRFDFTRWNLDGMAGGDAIIGALADLTQRLVTTPEWRQHFGEAAAQLHGAGRELYRNHLAELRQGAKDLEEDFNARAAAAEQRIEDHRRSLASSAAPPSADPDPVTYRLAVKVVAGTEEVGLAGLLVQLTDPQNERLGLAEGVTDADGSVLLSVPPERARELEDAHTTLAVRTLEGKPLHDLKDSACIRLNQTETRVVRLPELRQLKPLVAAALEQRAAREATYQNLIARVARLQIERDDRLRDMECRVRETEAIIADFDHPPEIPVEEIDRSRPPAGEGKAGAKPPRATPAGKEGSKPQKKRPGARKGRGRKPGRGGS
jgi:hypothetical protein